MSGTTARLVRAGLLTAIRWVQLVGHFPFVGLPIVASIGGRAQPSQ